MLWLSPVPGILEMPGQASATDLWQGYTYQGCEKISSPAESADRVD
jgi:hypothetical protein